VFAAIDVVPEGVPIFSEKIVVWPKTVPENAIPINRNVLEIVFSKVFFIIVYSF
jgi:hypothetical protein